MGFMYNFCMIFTVQTSCSDAKIPLLGNFHRQSWILQKNQELKMRKIYNYGALGKILNTDFFFVNPRIIGSIIQ